MFDPKNAGTIYAPYIRLDWSGAPPEFGLAKSTDGGGNWAVINPAIPGSYIVSLAVAADSSLYTSYDNSFRVRIPVGIKAGGAVAVSLQAGNVSSPEVTFAVK